LLAENGKHDSTEEQSGWAMGAWLGLKKARDLDEAAGGQCKSFPGYGLLMQKV
jgi:hypothetical protein